MNPIEIAYFKHFMLDKSEHMKFLVRYRKCRFKTNPESFEAYLLQTTVEDVILKAFAFQVDNVGTRYSYTYNYWKEVDNAWQKYWPLMENNHSNERWWDLKATFSILRQNWDKKEFYLKENMETIAETFKRLGTTPPQPKMKEEVIDNKEPKPTLIQFDEEDDPLADFDFFELDKNKNCRLRSNEMSINTKNSNKLTFNMFESKEIISKGFKYAKLGKNKAGDICLVLNNSDGVIVKTNGRSKKQEQNVTINSSDICKKLVALFDINVPYTKLTINRLPSEIRYFIYKITKQ